MKQSKGLNGYLKPENKKTKCRTTRSLTTDIDSQARQYVVQLKKEAKPSTIIRLTTMHAVCHRISML